MVYAFLESSAKRMKFKVDMNSKSSRNCSKWSSLTVSVIALLILMFLQWNSPFDSGNMAGKIMLVQIVMTLIAIILGLIALPTWQGFIALIISSYIVYCFLFTQIFAIS